VGSGVAWAAVDQAHHTVYVANFNDGTVSVISGARCNARLTSGCGSTWPTVTTGANPAYVAVDPSSGTAFVVNHVGGDQGDVEGFGQGDVLSVVGGQVGMKALQARPQGQHVLPFDGELAVRRRQGDRGPRGRATGCGFCSPRRRSCAAWAPQYEPPMRWPTCPADPKQSRNAGYPHVPYETWPRSEKLGSRMAAGRPPWS
jgi:hypothetical protein